MRRLFTAAVLAIAVASTAFAERADAPAPLTDVQKLQIINAAQAAEIAELRAQQAREALQRALAAVAVPGYQLNEKLEYVKAPPKK